MCAYTYLFWSKKMNTYLYLVGTPNYLETITLETMNAIRVATQTYSIFFAQTIYGIEQYNEIRPDCLMIHPYLPLLLMCHRVCNSHEFGHKIWYKQVIIFAHHNFASLHTCIYIYILKNAWGEEAKWYNVSLRPWKFFEDLAKYPLPSRRKKW